MGARLGVVDPGVDEVVPVQGHVVRPVIGEGGGAPEHAVERRSVRAVALDDRDQGARLGDRELIADAGRGRDDLLRPDHRPAGSQGVDSELRRQHSGLHLVLQGCRQRALHLAEPVALQTERTHPRGGQVGSDPGVGHHIPRTQRHSHLIDRGDRDIGAEARVDVPQQLAPQILAVARLPDRLDTLVELGVQPARRDEHPVGPRRVGDQALHRGAADGRARQRAGHGPVPGGALQRQQTARFRWRGHTWPARSARSSTSTTAGIARRVIECLGHLLRSSDSGRLPLVDCGIDPVSWPVTVVP